MKQYEFHNLDINERGDPSFLPPEALYIIQENGVGTPIEDLIDGYQTLNVSGRELVGYSLKTEDVTGSDGAMFLSANYPTREIEVTYFLQAKTDEEFRAKYQLLNYYLSGKQFKFYFYDDTQYFWTGTVTAADKPDPGLNQAKSTFTITCSNPFKRLIEPVTYKGTGSVRIAEPVYYGTAPDLIQIALASSASAISVTNSRQTISLTGTFVAGDVVKIEPSTDEEQQSMIYLNDKQALNLLDLTSDFENFAVKQGDVVTVTPSADLMLKLRRREL
ncbi:MAG: phage tail family protein [Lactobacillus sp.]|jgi:predicted phage tail component-like protein|nr:phage tail family protein [Lactobacillus sp.]